MDVIAYLSMLNLADDLWDSWCGYFEERLTVLERNRTMQC